MNFWLKIALFARKSLLAPKVHFEPKLHFWAQKVILERKVYFCDLDPKLLHLSFVLKVFGAKCKNNDFYIKFSKNVKMLRSVTPTLLGESGRSRECWESRGSSRVSGRVGVRISRLSERDSVFIVSLGESGNRTLPRVSRRAWNF